MTPPFSEKARSRVGYLLRLVQSGRVLSMPVSRPMPVIGPRCHELRLKDESHSWRIVYRVDVDAVLVVDVFDKNQSKTPKNVIENCRKTLSGYDRTSIGST